MERLTEVENGTAMVKGCGSNCKYGFEYCRKEDWENCKTIDDVIDKLAEYEDLEDLIGIPMKDLAEILRQNIPEDCKHPHKAVVLTDDDVDRWNGYKNAEEQGLLLRLPCKVGDELYRINCGAKEPIIKMRVLQIHFKQLHKDRNLIRIDTINDKDMGEGCYLLDDLGKTVFLTQAEAEQKLKEMEGSHDKE